MEKFEERTAVILENHGEKMFGTLHRPLVSGKVPAVLICHGLDGTKVSRFRLYVLIAEMLAQKGIATLRLDFRGCGDSEGHFDDAAISKKVEDALMGLDFLKNESFVDTSRMGIIGRSLGGAVAVKAASQYGQIKSMVLLSAAFGTPGGFRIPNMSQSVIEEVISNKIKQLTTVAPGNQLIKEIIALDVEKELLTLSEIPVLLLHGLMDQTVTLDQLDNYVRCRRYAKAPTKYIPLQSCSHEYLDAEERALLLNETVNWLSTTL